MDDLEKPTLHVELSVRGAPQNVEELREDWRRFFEQRARVDADDLTDAPEHLLGSFGGVLLVQTEDEDIPTNLAARFYNIHVHLFQLNFDPPAVEELEPHGGDDEWTAACDSLTLPHTSLHGLWESLIFDDNIKRDLLQFANSALLFSDRGVCGHRVHWNRLILLNGPPGTGKTSLCRALAQKLAIRTRYDRATLLEIHSHSLFSKWFSTSGKLVARLFEMVRDMVQDDPRCLLVVLIDEIESLAGRRSAMGLGSDPSDALRAVNSLLTSLDRLKEFSNVLVVATTNITHAVDDAFLDRADLNIHIGPPCLEARYEILRSCLVELTQAGIVRASDDEQLLPMERVSQQDTNEASNKLLAVAAQAKGLSGRALRKLPLQAHALYVRKPQAPLRAFLVALGKSIVVPAANEHHHGDSIVSGGEVSYESDI